MKNSLYHLELHKKAIAILEMIERCERIVKDANTYLMVNKNASWFDYTKGTYEKEVIKYSAIRNRLLSYYASTIWKITSRVINNAVELGTIVITETGAVEVI